MATFSIGTVYVTSTNANPSTLGYEGTWELIDKKFADTTIVQDTNTTIFSIRNNLTLNDAHITRSGHLIQIYLDINTTANLDIESNLRWGTFNLTTLGITEIKNNPYFISWSETGNAALAMQVYFSSASDYPNELYDNDIYLKSKSTTDTFPSGSNVKIEFTIHPDKSTMLDSVCDKFYWKNSLKNTTWVFKDTITLPDPTAHWTLDFNAGNNYFVIQNTSSQLKYGTTVVYNLATGWVNSNYKTITFTDDNSVDSYNYDFLNWLESNATVQNN